MAAVKGVWVFKDSINFYASGGDEGLCEQTANFTSNGTQYTSFRPFLSGDGGDYDYYQYCNDDGYTPVYYGVSGWAAEAYKTIDFGSVEQTVSDDFYTWLTANATQQESGGSEEEGGGGSVTVTYNGEVIVSLSAGQTATLNCAGKKMVSDIYIIAQKVEQGSGEIGFTIDGTSYQAEEGMTWGDWVESDYNTDNYGAFGSYIVQSTTDQGAYLVINSSGTRQLLTHTIQANEAYSIYYLNE